MAMKAKAKANLSSATHAGDANDDASDGTLVMTQVMIAKLLRLTRN